MTWSKFGTEFSAECALAGLTDAAFRLHVETILWIYLVEASTCKVPKRLLGRMLGEAAETAAAELVAVRFWRDRGSHYEVLHHAPVIRQSIGAQVKHRVTEAERQREKRKGVGTNNGATQTVIQTSFGGSTNLWPVCRFHMCPGRRSPRPSMRLSVAAQTAHGIVVVRLSLSVM